MKDFLSFWIQLLPIVLLLSGFVYGQEDISSREQWKRFQENAQEFLLDHSFRMKLTVENRPSEKDGWKSYSYQEIEHSGSDRTRISYRQGYYEQVIWIGKTSYSKRPNENWIVKTHDDEPTSVAAVLCIRDPGAVFNISASRLLFGESMTLLQSGSRRVWLDQQGRCRRVEEITYTDSVPGPRFIRTTRDYEYDSSISINSPIL